MDILNKINSSDDIKRLDQSELETLCDELRRYIIKNVSQTGGHLASNLGSVELTVALHRVYDSSRDRIVFDVGHQSYSHKIITGRRDMFNTLRCHGGISGFPKPYEADDDAFVAGHASDSVSVALGMAHARTLKKQNYDVVAVIGDGALTGGLAYEGLSNLGGGSEPMVVILNDNGMSINGNVGGMARLLSEERVKPGYINFKRWYRNAFGSVPALYDANHKLKEALKRRILPTNVFDAMGIYYLGPVDGHDVAQLETVIRWARDMRTPVLVHAITQKGRGYKFAEEHPERYHGVGKFDYLTGELPQEKKCFSTVFGTAMCRLAEANPDIVAITAAMSAGTGLDAFSRKFPDRFFDVGIAEEHAVSMAAGMAKQGLVPVFAVYSSFLQRAYDMLIHDISLLDLHVVFCVDRAGLVGNDGETHHGVFDISYLSSVPGMKILCPSSYAELELMLDEAINKMSGPVAIRYPRGGEGDYSDCLGLKTSLVRCGDKLTIVAYGTMINTALKVSDMLSAQGIECDVVKIASLKPLDSGCVIESLKKTGRLLVCEDVCTEGSIGTKLLALSAEAGVKLSAFSLNDLGEGIVAHGSVSELMRDCGLDADSLFDAALKLVRDKQ